IPKALGGDVDLELDAQALGEAVGEVDVDPAERLGLVEVLEREPRLTPVDVDQVEEAALDGVGQHDELAARLDVRQVARVRGTGSEQEHTGHRQAGETAGSAIVGGSSEQRSLHPAHPAGWLKNPSMACAEEPRRSLAISRTRGSSLQVPRVGYTGTIR